MTITETRATPTPYAPKKGSGSRVALLSMWIVSILLIAVVLFVPLDRAVIGGAVLALTVSLLLTGTPIAISMFIAGAVGVWTIAGPTALSAIVANTVFDSAAQWTLSVIPGFVLMGSLLWKSGLTDRLFLVAQRWLGWLPGGLAVGSNFAGAGLASVSGSTIGVTYALGRVSLPAMLDAGYNKRLAAGTVSVVGTLGQLIPPSILLVVYAGVAQTPVGPQLLAAIIPAVILAVAYALLIIIRVVINPSLAPRQSVADRPQVGLAETVNGLLPFVFIFGGIVGGMFFGLFTATEAAAFGVVAAAVIALIFNHGYRTNPKQFLRDARDGIVEAITATATIFLLLTAVNMLTRAMSVSELTSRFSDFVISMDLSRFWFLLILVAMYLLLGLFLEPMAMILLTVPILMQPLEFYGVDLIWFGVFVLILGEIAQVTPPVGIMSYIVHRLMQDPEVNRGHQVSLGDVFRGAIPFIALTLGFVLLLIGFPEITEILQPQQ